MITSSEEGASTVAPNPDIGQVKGNNLSTGIKLAMAAAVEGALAIIYFAVFAGKHF